MTAPQPVPAVLCDTCGLSWDDHLTAASFRTSRLYDEDEREVETVDEPVSVLDCLRLTQEANRGRPGFGGPPGSQGSQGPRGLPGRDATPFGGSAT